MKRTIRKIINIVRFDNSHSGHELFIAVGLAMAVGAFLKMEGLIYIDSD